MFWSVVLTDVDSMAEVNVSVGDMEGIIVGDKEVDTVTDGIIVSDKEGDIDGISGLVVGIPV